MDRFTGALTQTCRLTWLTALRGTLQLQGMRINGQLNTCQTIVFNLRDAPNINNAFHEARDPEYSTIPPTDRSYSAADLTRSQIDGDVNARGIEINGDLNISNTRIGGNLLLGACEALLRGGGTSPANDTPVRYALDLSKSSVRGNIELGHRLRDGRDACPRLSRFYGGIDLRLLKVGGMLDAQGLRCYARVYSRAFATQRLPNMHASSAGLDIPGATILAEALSVEGGVDFGPASFGQYTDSIYYSPPNSRARRNEHRTFSGEISLPYSEIAGQLRLSECLIDGDLSITYANVGNIISGHDKIRYLPLEINGSFALGGSTIGNIELYGVLIRGSLNSVLANIQRLWIRPGSLTPMTPADIPAPDSQSGTPPYRHRSTIAGGITLQESTFESILGECIDAMPHSANPQHTKKRRKRLDSPSIAINECKIQFSLRILQCKCAGFLRVAHTGIGNSLTLTGNIIGINDDRETPENLTASEKKFWNSMSIERCNVGGELSLRGSLSRDFTDCPDENIAIRPTEVQKNILIADSVIGGALDLRLLRIYQGPLTVTRVEVGGMILASQFNDDELTTREKEHDKRDGPPDIRYTATLCRYVDFRRLIAGADVDLTRLELWHGTTEKCNAPDLLGIQAERCVVRGTLRIDHETFNGNGSSGTQNSRILRSRQSDLERREEMRQPKNKLTADHPLSKLSETRLFGPLQLQASSIDSLVISGRHFKNDLQCPENSLMNLRRATIDHLNIVDTPPMKIQLESIKVGWWDIKDDEIQSLI